MNPQDVQTGIISTVFARVDGLHLYDYSAVEPIPPALYVQVDQLTYGTTFEDGSEATFLLSVIVGTVATKGSQAQLYHYIAPHGSLSIPAALADDPTLNGTVMSSLVLPTRRIGPASRVGGDTLYWEAQLPLAIWSLE